MRFSFEALRCLFFQKFLYASSLRPPGMTSLRQDWECSSFKYVSNWKQHGNDTLASVSISHRPSFSRKQQAICYRFLLSWIQYCAWTAFAFRASQKISPVCLYRPSCGTTVLHPSKICSGHTNRFGNQRSGHLSFLEQC